MIDCLSRFVNLLTMLLKIARCGWLLTGLVNVTWKSLCCVISFLHSYRFTFHNTKWPVNSLLRGPFLYAECVCVCVCSLPDINPFRAKFFRGNINIFLHFVSFLHIDTTQVFEILPQIDKNLPILHSQYYGCWCPGDVRSQGISSHGIDLVKPK